MARRRSGLPASIRSELPLRAKAGIGLDPEFPTKVGEKVCPAAAACQRQPSSDMLDMVRDIMIYLKDNDAQQVRLLQQWRDRGQPGALLIAWSSNEAKTSPSASEIATRFAVSTSTCGTPRLPSWLSLRVDDDFDLRWQPAF
jgi:hypothetical protein